MEGKVGGQERVQWVGGLTQFCGGTSGIISPRRETWQGRGERAERIFYNQEYSTNHRQTVFFFFFFFCGTRV
jgi:hypothetical protein